MNRILVLIVVCAALGSGCSRREQQEGRILVANSIEELKELRDIQQRMIRKGETPPPLRLSPELHSGLVAEGILKPREEGVTFMFDNSPVRLVLQEYSMLTGVAVEIDESIQATVSVRSGGPISRKHAALLIRTALEEQGIALVEAGSNSLHAVPKEVE